eukprot:Skav225523  [mRNA]  locus=scaffold3039:85591:86910:- [translate_table: standard]
MPRMPRHGYGSPKKKPVVKAAKGQPARSAKQSSSRRSSTQRQGPSREGTLVTLKHVSKNMLPTFSQAEPLIQSLKAAVALENPRSIQSNMSQIRRQLKGNSREDRMKKRSQLRNSSQQTLRFSGQTLLESMAVSPSTAADYARRVAVFQTFCKILQLPLRTASQVDFALTTFLNESFQEGLDIADGQKFLAATLEAWPMLGKWGLTRSRRALKGWKNLDPGYSRPPLAWPFLSLVIMTMFEMKHHIAALCVLTMFVTYIRPSEALKLTVQDLTFSQGLGTPFALNLNSTEEMETSKVGLSDEAILLDSKTVNYLGPALRKMTLHRQAHEPLFQLSYPQLALHWKEALRKLGLPESFAVLYQLRHSGASWDALQRHRSLLEIKLRGRWSADASLKRYESHAKVAQTYEKLPAALKRKAEASPQLLQAMVGGFITRHGPMG